MNDQKHGAEIGPWMTLDGQTMLEGNPTTSEEMVKWMHSKACIEALEGWKDPSAAKELLEAAKPLADLFDLCERCYDGGFVKHFDKLRAVLKRIEGKD